jgi:hypothetical protein
VDVVDSLRWRHGLGVDRAQLVAVQTPQGFDRELLAPAHEMAGEASDDAGLMDAAGFEVRLVEGEPSNIKITNPTDLAVANALLDGLPRSAQVRSASNTADDIAEDGAAPGR